MARIVRKSCFYELAKPGPIGVPNQNLQDIGTELFETHKTSSSGSPL